MDSMRTLNTSLPSTTSPRKHHQPPEQLLQAFKAAALSVTNLYKTAATDQQAAQESGYQDALEELLAFLDKERLGHNEGEGSRIRQWVTERISGSTVPASGDSDEEAEDEKRARSSSPVLERKLSEEISPVVNIVSNSERPDSAPPASTDDLIRSVPTGDFTFRSSHPYPNPNDTEMDTTDSTNISANAATAMPSMRLEVFPRGTRNSPRHQNRNSRTNTSNTLGPGAGVKRRPPLIDDLFDLGSLGNSKDRFSGGKKGRFL